MMRYLGILDAAIVCSYKRIEKNDFVIDRSTVKDIKITLLEPTRGIIM